MYLLDTNVISELRRPNRDPNVLRWISAVATAEIYLSVITIGEIARGIAKLRRTESENAIAQADALQSWLEGCWRATRAGSSTSMCPSRPAGDVCATHIHNSRRTC
jgi:predicted nucleic acid-binding protein